MKKTKCLYTITCGLGDLLISVPFIEHLSNTYKIVIIFCSAYYKETNIICSHFNNVKLICFHDNKSDVFSNQKYIKAAYDNNTKLIFDTVLKQENKNIDIYYSDLYTHINFNKILKDDKSKEFHKYFELFSKKYPIPNIFILWITNRSH